MANKQCEWLPQRQDIKVDRSQVKTAEGTIHVHAVISPRICELVLELYSKFAKSSDRFWNICSVGNIASSDSLK
jgi:hypothetical protein